MAGFTFHETMAGSLRLAGDPVARAMSFSIGARSLAWSRFLRRPEVEIEGAVDVEGFADHRYLRGTLGMDPLRTGILPYAFRFTANDGASYAFAGMKTLRVGRLVESMTVLPGAILDAGGAIVGEALLRFDVRSDLAAFLKGFRRG
jgi:hypothetical protein